MSTDDPSRTVDAPPDRSVPPATDPGDDDNDARAAAADRADYLDAPGTEEPTTYA